MKTLISALFALAVNCFVGAGLASIVGVAPVFGAIGLNAASLAFPMPGGALFAGLYQEIWTGEMIKKFRNSLESLGWLKSIRSVDDKVKNDAIHFVHLGGDPTVLINNNTYPLEVETLEDADKVIGLDKYQTKPTVITDDELHALSYDKMGSTIERHNEAISEKKFSKALHALAPASNKTDTPVLLTSGENSTDGLRKKLTAKDVIALKREFDQKKIPLAGRILVLCPEHVQDLLEEDRAFSVQYNNYTSGKIANLYSFEVYEYVDVPSYTVSTKTKLAFGAVPTATERNASVAYFAPRMIKATGSTKTYLADAASNPEMQQSLVSFRHYFMCLPLKEEAMGAIVSNVNS